MKRITRDRRLTPVEAGKNKVVRGRVAEELPRLIERHEKRMDASGPGAEAIRRYVSDEPFPPYSYVNGLFPHPIRDPAGHSFGVAPKTCNHPDPDRWRDCRPYLFGVDLFNYGFYWEAHEVWEGVWNACGRNGIAASFIKGLIKLAAGGVKAREGRVEGLRRHARRAAELFGQVAGGLPPEQTCYFGLSLPWLIGVATDTASGSVNSSAPSASPVEFAFSFVLQPGESQRSDASA